MTDIALKYGVTRRTVERDFEALRIVLAHHTEASTARTRFDFTNALRIGAVVFLVLMLAGAEIRLHFAPSFDILLLLFGVWTFWHFTRPRWN